MKKLAVISAMVICLAACSQQPDPFKDAVETEIIRLVGPDAKVRFNTFELIDSTTVGKELDYRLSLIETRRKQNLKFNEKYLNEGKQTNARIKAEAAAKDAVVIEGIKAIRERMAAADSLDVVVYYDYHVTGEAKSESGITTFADHYACVGADGTVLNFTDNQKTLHKGVGKVIAGYLTVLKGDSEEE